MITTDPLGIGVVGAGMIAQRGILPHLSQSDVADRLHLQAVCDPVPGRAEASAQRFGIERAYRSLDELLADPDVDAVTIASPIGLHFEQAKAALQAGMHVHVNKTMTTTVAEANELIDVAGSVARRLVASPGEVLRPQLTAIRDLIAGGAIGTPSWAICGCALGSYHESDELAERESAPGGMPVDPSWYFRRPGGGPMYDMTAYALHQLTSVLGPASTVTALSSRVVAEREFRGSPIPVEVDDNTIALLEFGGGMTAVVHGTAAGTVVDEFAAGVYFGTEGSISGVSLNGEPIEFRGRELTLDRPSDDWDAQMRVLPHVTGTHRELPESHVFEDIMQLVDLVREGTPTPVTPEHARHVIDIIEASYRSADTGQAQRLETSFEYPPATV